MSGRRPRKFEWVESVNLLCRAADGVALDAGRWRRVGATLLVLVSSSMFEHPAFVPPIAYMVSSLWRWYEAI
jgi:hypothetical protein